MLQSGLDLSLTRAKQNVYGKMDSASERMPPWALLASRSLTNGCTCALENRVLEGRLKQSLFRKARHASTQSLICVWMLKKRSSFWKCERVCF